MAFDFAAVKAQTRRVVHDTFGVSATYRDSVITVPVGLRIRWHNKIARFGNLLDQGYAEIIEGINRVIFDTAELSEKSVVLRRGGELTITAPSFNSAVLTLAEDEPTVGPLEVVWLVTVKV